MTNSDTMDIRRYGGLSVHAGVILVLAGTALVVVPLLDAVQIFESRQVSSYRRSVRVEIKLSLVGIACIVGGIAIARSPSRIVLDRKRRTARAVWDLGVTVRAREGAIDAGTPVVLAKHEVWIGHGTLTTYRVSVLAAFGEVALESAAELPKARSRAREIAMFLGAPLEDRTGPEPVVTAAGAIGVPLREQMRRMRTELEPPDQPAESRVTYDVRGDEVVFDIPARGSRWTHHLASAIGGIVSAGLITGIVLLVEQGSPPGAGANIAAIVLGGLVAPIAVAWLLIVPGTTRIRETVIASPHRLRVEHRRLFRTKTSEMGADEVEELVVAPSGMGATGGMLRPGLAVHARGESRSLEFGVGLTRDDLEWLRGMALALLAASGRAGPGG